MDEERVRIATNIRKGVLEFCVLALLARRDMYGLELADELVARDLTASEGSLYPLLARMQQAGVVASRHEAPAGSRPRKYYAITDDGTAQLATFADVWGRISRQVDDTLGETA
ncbi:PadR family transcriptional regulator [Microbacterium faecale]|uniref:PadR family transcriptional regulator n=1 Tax=Microbacterium faecale TaxID=1804630 RepID=A0A917DGG2_9MICO|nr:PadR family transcriptional regulator [Microbacterium faecale]GGD35077.1 PadR family transcriptional regulator [Microbacterium faecale]